MIHISRERIEREIELQRRKRERKEGIITKPLKKPTPPKIPKKAPKKKVHKKRKTYNQKPKIKEEGRKVTSKIQRILFKTLILNGSMTRKELMSDTMIPWTTLFDNLNELLRRKVLIKYPRDNGKRGRPMVVWELSKNPNNILELNEL